MSPNICPYIFKLFSFYKKKSNCLVFHSYTSTSSTSFTHKHRDRGREKDLERERKKKAAMFSQSLFEDHQDMSSQLGFFSFPPNCNNMGIISTTTTTTTLPFIGYNQNTLKTLTMSPPSFDHYINIESTHDPRHKEDLTTSIFGGPHLLSLQKSNPNTW